SASGLRAGSGVTVGVLGQAIGVHWSLGLSSAALCLGTGLAALYTRGGRRAPAQEAAAESVEAPPARETASQQYDG
ncbi:hypothetical protein ABT297_42865, partial [Dactylosporangium sp. NPDC000555]